MLDEATDYKYDISEWLEDCLDEIDMREEYEVLFCMCDTLLSLFSWPDYTAVSYTHLYLMFYLVSIRNRQT